MLKVDPAIHSHDIQHRVIPNDFMRDISKQEETSICPPDASCVAGPDLQPEVRCFKSIRATEFHAPTWHNTDTALPSNKEEALGGKHNQVIISTNLLKI